MKRRIKYELFDEFIKIDELNFCGTYHRSENGNFILAWTDYGFMREDDDDENKKYGKIILLYKDRIVLRVESECPLDGKVSNDGTFIINDIVSKEKLQSTFYALNLVGEIIIKHSFNALLYNNGLSSDGQYAVCQTYGNDTDDGGKLFFFDLKEKRLVWNCYPKTGWANYYNFDTNKEILYLFYDDGRIHHYSFDGKFLDNK